ncbi:MAG: diguanylate cyclase [Magnetococcus sp. YQC-5]
MQIAVLFVDDEQEVLDVLVQGYGPPVYTVYQALSVRQALDFLRAEPIDILVTDLLSTDQNGLIWIQEAKELRASLQVILMCGPEERSRSVHGMAHHIAIEIQKTDAPDALQRYIEHCADIKRIQEALHQKEEQLKVETANRKHAEHVANRALTTRIAISALLETSLEPMSLEKQVEVLLEIILTVPWFSGMRKGVLFLMDETAGDLRMVGQKKLSEPLLIMCARVPLGHCLCGKAGAQRETIFTNRLDDKHTNGFVGMMDHGHYCVPIINKDRLLGVLCLYLKAGHQRRQDEDALLSTISQTLALILEHRHTESELKLAEDQLRFMAYHDPLTGLHNRQFFDVTFNKIFMALQNATRRQSELPFQGAFLAIFDIDHFKKVNDTYGHMMGDEVLVLFARMITECFRDKDSSFRFGGEEFVVLLNDISPDAAEMVLNRFRKAIESYAFPQVGQVTVSIGAVRIEVGELAGTLIEKADKALYYSKSNGRNQVNIYHSLVASGHLQVVEDEAEEVELW